jgi:hypothetical protein
VVGRETPTKMPVENLMSRPISFYPHSYLSGREAISLLLRQTSLTLCDLALALEEVRIPASSFWQCLHEKASAEGCEICRTVLSFHYLGAEPASQH